MRCIGQLTEETQAREIGDYLYVHGVANTIAATAENAWEIWVHDESKLAQAKGMFDEFQRRPDDRIYQEAAGQAVHQRKQAYAEQDDFRKRYLTKDVIFPGGLRQIGRLTLVLIAISVIISAICGLGSNMTLLRYFVISEYRISNAPWLWYKGLGQIAQGQIWRLFTPMFIHFSILHLLFNMLWLKDLGTMIEKRQSSRTLAALVLVIAVISNLAQYAVSGPMFGGMSGVVYGLLGYIWIRGKTDPFSGLYLHQQTVIMMLVWFALGFTGAIGSIANMAHGAGLVLGIGWGFISGRLAKRPYHR